MSTAMPHSQRSFRFILSTTLLTGAVLLTAPSSVVAQDGQKEESKDVELAVKPVPVAEGIRRCSFGSDPKRFATTGVYKASTLSAIDLHQPPHPMLAHAYHHRRFFYVFYNVVTGAKGPRKYLIQRIKKTVRNERPGNEPHEETTYLVEAFKTLGDVSKRPDEHFGGFSLGPNRRRVIDKEFEVGFASLKEIAEDDAWPFDNNKLYHRIHGYKAESDTFNQVEFTNSVTWRMRLEFDGHGNYSFVVPELGYRIEHQVPTLHDAHLEKGTILLERGEGAAGVPLGATVDEIRRKLGKESKSSRVQTARQLHYAERLIFHLPDDTRATKTIQTTPGFRGVTARGIGHGDSREEVLQTYGRPYNKSESSMYYPGVVFSINKEGEVSRIVIHGK